MRVIKIGSTHEQLHFDIAELIARKSRKEISLGEYDKQTFKIQFNSIAKKFLVMLNIEQDLFDQQTNHAMNENKENEWENKVANELKEMEIYGDSIVLTHLRKGLWKH